jgi:hypothetical protein
MDWLRAAIHAYARRPLTAAEKQRAYRERHATAKKNTTGRADPGASTRARARKG